MTKDEINRAVAEKVMGWDYDPLGGILDHHKYPAYILEDSSWIRVKDWNPAERIDHAWMVVEKLRNDDWLVSVKVMPPSGSYLIEGARSEYDAPCPDRYVGKGKVLCELEDMRKHKTFADWRRSHWELADTAPMAICLAALKAKEGE